MWPAGFEAICGLRLLVLHSAPRGFPAAPVSPSQQKLIFYDLSSFDLIDSLGSQISQSAR